MPALPVSHNRPSHTMKLRCQSMLVSVQQENNSNMGMSGICPTGPATLLEMPFVSSPMARGSAVVVRGIAGGPTSLCFGFQLLAKHPHGNMCMPHGNCSGPWLLRGPWARACWYPLTCLLLSLLGLLSTLRTLKAGPGAVPGQGLCPRLLPDRKPQ